MLPDDKLKQIAEAVLFAIGAPLSADRVIDLFPDEEKPDRKQVKAVLDQLAEDYQGRVSSCARWVAATLQVRVEFAPWVTRLWEEKPPRYSRALLETLALIAYRQPITRGEIEDVRGVAVSTNIMKLLTEREWVRVVGHRDVPANRPLCDHAGVPGLLQLVFACRSAVVAGNQGSRFHQSRTGAGFARRARCGAIRRRDRVGRRNG